MKLAELIEFAKTKSPFYQKLYQGIKFTSLESLPIVNEEAFWEAQALNKIITDPKMHGLLLRSGGTMGKPKVSVFSSKDWSVFCKTMSSKLEIAKLIEPHDRIANLFVYGSLYGSFLFVNDMLLKSELPILQLPIGMGSDSDIETAASLIQNLNANVVLSTPYLLVKLALFVQTHKIKGIELSKVLYGGDVMLKSQSRFIQKVFPNALISSSGYASTDAGFLGYADVSCDVNEYRTDPDCSIMEIIDEETGDVIEEEGVIGRLIMTNLTKALMPVIRYPVGDLAMWCEPSSAPCRKLRLVGRHTKKEDKIVLGGKTFAYQDFCHILEKSKFCGHILGFQIDVNDQALTLQIASDVKDKKAQAAAKREIQDLILQAIPKIRRKIEVEFIDFFDLKYNARTYKAIKMSKK